MDIFKKLEENGITASGHFSGHFWGQDTHLSWVLTDDGVLTIVGKGNLDDMVEDFEWRLDDTDYKCRAFNYPKGILSGVWMIRITNVVRLIIRKDALILGLLIMIWSRQ